MSWYFRVLKKYAVFQGRAHRKEFWMFVLFSSITVFLLGFIEGALGLWPYTEESVLADIYSLAVALPALGVSVRRMHDTDRSGWWCIVPFVNLYFSCLDGTSGDNRFGPDPKGVAIGPTKADFIPDSPIYRDSPPPAQVDAIAQSPEDSSRQNVDQSQSLVLSCSECGHENPAEVNFCTKCRAKLTLECNKCRFKSPQGSEFCGSCGEDTEFRVEKMARNAVAEAAAAEALRVRVADGLIPVERYFDNGQLYLQGGQKEGKWHGPYEEYHEDGQSKYKGTYNMGKRCGKWIQERTRSFSGKPTTGTVTHPPCPPGLEDGN